MLGAHFDRKTQAAVLQQVKALNRSDRADRLEGAVQVFVHNPRSGHFLRKPLPDLIQQEQGRLRLYVHSPYVDRLRDSAESARACAQRASQAAEVGAFGYVIHLYCEPVALVLRFLERFFAACRSDRICLFLEAAVVSKQRGEAAPDGRYIDPGTMSELLRKASKKRWFRRLGLCFDTAHMWSCGWDPTSVDALVRYFAPLRPWLRKLRVMVHLNDSKQMRGEDSRDRHAPLGDNMWSHESLASFLTFCRRLKWDCIVETVTRLNKSLQFIEDSREYAGRAADTQSKGK